MVSKKDDASRIEQYRVVVNHKDLNASAIILGYLLPTIQKILDLLHGAKVFTIIEISIKFVLHPVISIEQHFAHV